LAWLDNVAFLAHIPLGQSYNCYHPHPQMENRGMNGLLKLFLGVSCRISRLVVLSGNMPAVR